MNTFKVFLKTSVTVTESYHNYVEEKFKYNYPLAFQCMLELTEFRIHWGKLSYTHP